jgi:hypothetical protein
MTKKFVINRCYGGFGLSEEGLNLYNSLSEKSLAYSYDIDRDDPFLVQVVETLGEKADGLMLNLKLLSFLKILTLKSQSTMVWKTMKSFLK